MDIKAVKKLAQEKTAAELQALAEELENSGLVPAAVSAEDHKAPEEHLSDLLQALEVRLLVDSGHSLSEAVREFSKRVRQSVSS